MSAAQGKALPDLYRALLGPAASLTDQRGLARLVSGLACGLEGIRRVGLYLRDPSDGHLQLLTTRGFGAEERRHALTGLMDRSVLELLAGAGRRVVPAPVQAHPGASRARRRLRQRWLVPVVHGRHTVGVLDLGSNTAEPLSAGQRRWLDQLGALAGMIYQDLVRSDELQRQEVLLRSITCSATDAIILVDGHGSVTYWNWAAESLFGFSQGEALGRDLHQMLVPSDLRPEARAGWRHFLRTGEGLKIGHVVELVARRKDGTEVPVEVSASTLDGPAGPVVVGIVRDITERRRSEDELHRARIELEERVVERTTELSQANERLVLEVAERRRAQEQLIRHQDQMRSLSSQLSLAEEAERRKIATAVHDNVGQNLALCRMKLGLLGRQAPERLPQVAEILELVDRAIHSTRTLTFELSTPILYELGLVAAVEWLGEQVEQEHGLRFRLSAPRRRLELATDLRVLLFRGVRELLFNVVKHAGASKVEIVVRVRSGWIHVAVEDDGSGFGRSPSEGGPGFGLGLFTIRERLTALGGHLRIERSRLGGARVAQVAPSSSTASQRGTEP